jgi:hypothetical protein
LPEFPIGTPADHPGEEFHHMKPLPKQREAVPVIP